MITPETLDTWIDQARLIAVIWTKRWTELNGICERASEFVKKESLQDPAFMAKLGEKSVFNADEISNTLQRNSAWRQHVEYAMRNDELRLGVIYD